MYEGHDRIAQALSAVLTSLIGFSAMLIGNFTRFGRWRQILGALMALAVLQSLDNAMADVARSDTSLWPLTYGAVVLGLGVAYAILWISARPGLFARLAAPRARGVPA